MATVFWEFRGLCHKSEVKNGACPTLLNLNISWLHSTNTYSQMHRKHCWGRIFRSWARRNTSRLILIKTEIIKWFLPKKLPKPCAINHLCTRGMFPWCRWDGYRSVVNLTSCDFLGILLQLPCFAISKKGECPKLSPCVQVKLSPGFLPTHPLWRVLSENKKNGHLNIMSYRFMSLFIKAVFILKW